jgi:threonine dehydratase
MSDDLPGIAEIRLAAARLAGITQKTPLIRNRELDRMTGAKVFLKAENLQHTGSFKLRGAYNAIAALPAEIRARGVVACSSGNHAQGVAEAARLLGVSATIVMPSDAPAIKVARTKRSGASVVPYDRASEDREAIATRICIETGAAMIHPYDNAMVIAGQGTAGLEIAEEMALAGETPAHVLACTGGGGLTAGVAIAVQDRFAKAKAWCVEPAGFDDHIRSLDAGRRLSNPAMSGSACDALLSPMPGELTFAVNRERLAGGFAVSDEQAFAAMRFAFAELKLVLEPGGAVALGALLANPGRFKGETVAAILSGGNVDPQFFAKIIAQ